MRRAGRSAATILDRLCSAIKPGMNTLEIDELAGEMMEDMGVKSACKGYRSGHRIFPSHTCLSVNDEVVHGIGISDRVLKDGDVISVDICIREDGMIGDNCRTIEVGTWFLLRWRNYLGLRKNQCMKGSSRHCIRTGWGTLHRLCKSM